MTLADVIAALDMIAVVLGIFMLVVTILFWVAIDQHRRILDALNLANLRESERRGWVRKEHEQG